MDEVKKALRAIYLDAIKESTKLYIGVELEFPIVNLTGAATDIKVSKALLSYLARTGDFVVEQYDSDGHPVQLINPQTDDRILFEVSYNILEIAFGKVEYLQEVNQRFQTYLAIIQSFLRTHNHELQGRGIHPAWDLNDNRPVKLPRYQMLMEYLSLGDENCHQFADYGAFICGNQVQFDVTRDNYLTVLNAFNQIEPAKAYLFPNSSFNGATWETNIARDIFWEESLHGAIPENVGVFPYDFKTEDEFLDYLTRTALFTVSKNRQTYYFSPQALTSYFENTSVLAYDLSGQPKELSPGVEDLDSHRAYHYQNLTRRGTVELRSVCAQPLEQTFAPIAFQLGLLENLAELKVYLQEAPFFAVYGRDYKQLRRRFAQTKLTSEEKNNIRKFSDDLLSIAKKGLRNRKMAEERFLTS